MTSSLPIASTREAPRRLRSLQQVFLLSSAASLVIVLQGLWAGIFLQHDGERDAAQSWIVMHARGGEVAIFLTVAVAAVGLSRLRSHREIWLMAVILVGLLVLESYLGGLIVDASADTLTAIHVPLALLIMGIAIWIPVRARHLRSHS